ncbi:hypothetical protein CkaCkLH20_09450 [Colletotrichum karsti]|uniref:Uncharacterized protein n=1 Tax=Colletotrichum karsti TaxID=1095194 RepID=A0A9P6LHU2_9PEZI|nr:uncharacterized protein CkaCkLH20_09450 [Colletotrichum karsti]KAF9872940.1 hypothetical protein CkaCkLH20_09450 [Colletotrichum karsti]
MASVRQLAILGGHPAFSPCDPVPLISPQGYRPKGDYSAVDAILANKACEDSTTRASKQRFVSKLLPGVGNSSLGYRIPLQRRIGDFLELDLNKTSVLCVTSGTNALRAVLKGIRATYGHTQRNEVIIPQLTVGATAEAVIDEGFKPVFVDVDPLSWLLSPEATKRCISNNTAAIVTVDWLGTLCNLNTFRKLADDHGIKLISDSAQSFGAVKGKPHSIDIADATIYSLGYPKVFTGAGSGGVIVCPKPLASVLENHSTGILRHETMAEVHAFISLRALDVLPQALETRISAGEMYRHLLADIPGIIFQEVPDGLGTNHYQVSVFIRAEDFGLNSEDLCAALKAENVHCSAARMPCIGTKKRFLQYGEVGGDLKFSRLLAENSVTLPIYNNISLETVERICFLIKDIHKKGSIILEAKQKPGLTCASSLGKSADIVDIGSKFRRHLDVPILNDSSVHSKVFVPISYLEAQNVSIDEVLYRFKSRREWSLDELVVAGLFVDAVIGKSVVLSPRSDGHCKGSDSAVALDESGSSASVTLVPGADGRLTVHKTAVGYGIDGNGAPWLRRQSIFLEASNAVKNTGIFVVPQQVSDTESGIRLVFPYIPSHSFGELIFANVGAKPAVAAIVDLLSNLATSVWTESRDKAHPDFIKQAHFGRMKRRVKIARERHELLDKILNQKSVMLNGKLLMGFDCVMENLEAHPELVKIGPTVLNEIHGDLNIHNILSHLDPDQDEPVALIDPRGVPLLDHSDDKIFERGDYAYDVSKLLFSLTGFSEIRKKLYNMSADGQSYQLEIQQHPGSDTMTGAAHRLIPELASNAIVRRWIDEVESQGTKSFELRVRLGEAAHFVADCACALGRDTPWEVVPLFLMGLEKLNNMLNLLNGIGQLSIDNSEYSSDSEAISESADLGALMIQSTIFGLQTSDEGLPYNVLEVSVKFESAATTQKLFREMAGSYLPKGTPVYLSTDPIASVDPSSCVLIHPSNGVRGQTHMFAAAARRTTAFFRDNGVPQHVIDGLKIVHISSTGSSSRSQYSARDNDKLLSPGSFGISPLKLALLQANQLPFPKAGRWVLENDSFFLLSRPLTLGGDDLCLLAIQRPTTGSTSSWRVCVNGVESINDQLFAKSFRGIASHEMGKKLLRTTTGLFVPHRLAKEISWKESDYTERMSPLLIDVVLPRFMNRNEWIELSHKQGYGIASHLVWQNAKDFQAIFPSVELAYGGDETAFYHYGSDKEYHKLLTDVPCDARLNSLAYAIPAAQWRHRRVDQKLW